MVNISITPQDKIHKSHVSLSFHLYREALVAKIVSYHFINGKINPIDVLSKHWDHHCECSTSKNLLFWTGDAMECLDKNALEFEEWSRNLFVLCLSFACWQSHVLRMKLFHI